jgi:hypothetical protein
VALADEHAGVVDALGKAQLEHKGLRQGRVESIGGKQVSGRARLIGSRGCWGVYAELPLLHSKPLCDCWSVKSILPMPPAPLPAP